MTASNPEEVLRAELIDRIISMYHTTRLRDTPVSTHILSKQYVRDAFEALAATSVKVQPVEQFAENANCSEAVPVDGVIQDDREAIAWLLHQAFPGRSAGDYLVAAGLVQDYLRCREALSRHSAPSSQEPKP